MCFLPVFFLFEVKSNPKIKNDDVFFKEGNTDEKTSKGFGTKI